MPSLPGKRARLGAPRVGRVRMANAAIALCTHRKSQLVHHPPLRGEENKLLDYEVISGQPRCWYALDAT